MTIVRTASFRADPERRQEVEAVVARFVSAVRDGEPGTRLYVALQEKDDPCRFLSLMVFEDAAAEDAHAGTEWVRRFTEGLYPNIVGGVAFAELTEVPGTS